MKLIDYISDGDFVNAGKNADDLRTLIERVRKKRNMCRWLLAVAMVVIVGSLGFLVVKAVPIFDVVASLGEDTETTNATAPVDLDSFNNYAKIVFYSILPPFGALALVDFVYAIGFTSSLRSLLLFQSYLEHSGIRIPKANAHKSPNS